MERPHLAVLLGFLLLAFSAGTMIPFPIPAVAADEGCDSSSLAGRLNRYCSSNKAPPTAPCCHAVRDVFRATMGGDPDCICSIQEGWAFIDIGIVIEDLAHIYAACGGRGPNPRGARLAVDACESKGTAPAEPPLPTPSSETTPF